MITFVSSFSAPFTTLASGAYSLAHFADGEPAYRLSTVVKDEPVRLIASVTADPASFFELLSLHQLLQDGGAPSIQIVIPYLCFSRLDKRTKTGEARLGIMVARQIKATKAHLVVLDVHSPRILRALGQRAEEITAIPLLAKSIGDSGPVDVVVAPDKGARDRAKRFADALGSSPRLAFISKKRPAANVAKATRLVGDVQGSRCVIVDDMIDTGGTIAEAVRLLRAHGSASIRIAATHGIFSAGAREKLAALPVEQIIVTNSLPQTPHQRIRVVDATTLLS
ncbi:ribose-phosphate pyrophosphokinase [Candidatus Uhrbacteria bacterium]|nr:ribose-phosphate pyrophosphokinase [Candidatus Uhrbacteria bacterium]